VVAREIPQMQESLGPIRSGRPVIELLWLVRHASESLAKLANPLTQALPHLTEPAWSKHEGYDNQNDHPMHQTHASH
jgi:hypothetical protein